MPYNDQGTGYQGHSETSRDAADNLRTGEKMRHLMAKFIEERGDEGATIDECSAYLSDALGKLVPPGTASARMGELEGASKVSKTPRRRRTRSGSTAAIYIWGSWKSAIIETKNIAPIPQDPEDPVQKLEDLQVKFGHGWVIPRADGSKNKCQGPLHCFSCHQVAQYYAALKQRREMDREEASSRQ